MSTVATDLSGVVEDGPLTVGIDAHGNSLYRDVQSRAQAKLEELYARL